MKKRILLAAISSLLIFSFAGCSAKKNDSALIKIKVGASITPHAEMLRECQSILKEKGYELEIIEMDDTIIPNTSLVEGSIDANFFQHLPYLEDFNAESGAGLVSVGAVHYEPFGIYAGKTKSLADLKEGAKVAVPNSVTNEARALLLLQQAGLITLKEGATIRATIQDIAENPLKLEFYETAGEQVPRTLNDVDIAVINGNYAIEAGLSVKNALATENADSIAAVTYGNILVTTKSKANDPGIIALLEALKSDAIKEFILQKYDGGVVPL